MNITPRSPRVFVQLFEIEIKKHLKHIKYCIILQRDCYTGRMPANLRSCSNTMKVTTVCGPMRSQLGTKPL